MNRSSWGMIRISERIDKTIGKEHLLTSCMYHLPNQPFQQRMNDDDDHLILNKENRRNNNEITNNDDFD